jgi:tellurite resistance protein
LADIPFSIEELSHSLDSAFLRKSFLRIAILVARADGKISDEEMAVLRRMAQALGINESLESLAADLEGKQL